MSNETTQVIYSMNKVGRIVPPNKQILRDISLGFYYGAKIGVLGLNGAGKNPRLLDISGIKLLLGFYWQHPYSQAFIRQRHNCAFE